MNGRAFGALVALVFLAPQVFGQSIFDVPRHPSLGRKHSARQPARTRARYTPTAPKLTDVGRQDVVAPPVDVALDDDTICPVVTRLGLITVFEFAEPIDYIWFSDSDRWRLEQDAFQLGISPGKGEDVDVKQTKWSETRETLYVRVEDGFTYKFALTVGTGAPNSFIRVHRKTPPPAPGPSAEELASAEEARRERETERQATEARRIARESAIAAARAVPFDEKSRRRGDLEARLSRPVMLGGATYLAFEIHNRTKSSASFVASVVSVALGKTPESEIVVERRPLAGGERRTGVVVLHGPELPPHSFVLRLESPGAKPLDLPIGE